MDFLEKDLEQIIYEASDEQLKDLRLSGKRYRQLKIGNYGIADLVFIKRKYGYEANTPFIEFRGLEITVCELKKDKIGIAAFFQAIRYCKGIKSYLEDRGFNCFEFRIVLIGRGVDDSGSFIFMPELFDNADNDCCLDKRIKSIKYFNYSYDYSGIKFNAYDSYRLTNEGFNFKTK